MASPPVLTAKLAPDSRCESNQGDPIEEIWGIGGEFGHDAKGSSYDPERWIHWSEYIKSNPYFINRTLVPIDWCEAVFDTFWSGSS